MRGGGIRRAHRPSARRWSGAVLAVAALGVSAVATSGVADAETAVAPVAGTVVRGIFAVGAVDGTGTPISVPLAESMGSDGSVAWQGSPGSRTWTWYPGVDGIPDPGASSQFTYAYPTCSVEEPMLRTAPNDPVLLFNQNDCWSVNLVMSSGPYGVHVPFTAVGNGGEPLVFDHWESSGVQLGPCLSGDLGYWRSRTDGFQGIDMPTLHTWFDRNGGTTAEQRFTAVAHYVPAAPDITAPAVSILSPSGCGLGTDPDGVVTHYPQGSVVLAAFGCIDPGNGPATSCIGTVPNGEPVDTATAGTKTFTVTATDAAGLTSTRTIEYVVDPVVAPDVTPPGITWIGGPADGATYLANAVPAAPTCVAIDDESGPADCTITGYSAEAGDHTLTATAHDAAGNETIEQRSYTVTQYRIDGFSQPVDMGGQWNAVKAGSAVPFSFEVFDGATELTSTSVVSGFVVTPIACTQDASTAADVEFTAPGGSSLVYDTVDGVFRQNWKTPRAPGACYRVAVVTVDGSSISALFQLR